MLRSTKNIFFALLIAAIPGTSFAAFLQLHSPVDVDQVPYIFTLWNLPVGGGNIDLKASHWENIKIPWYATDAHIIGCMGVTNQICDTKVTAFTPGTGDMLTFDDFLTQAGLIPNDYPAYTPLVKYPLLASPGNDIYIGIDLFALFNQGGVNYTLGQSFDVVNGVSSALPGYLIGTSEITLGSNGWETQNPLTGSVIAAADGAHCVPEPSSLSIIGLGLVAAINGFSLRRRVKVGCGKRGQRTLTVG